jgi:hypothetical protein
MNTIENVALTKEQIEKKAYALMKQYLIAVNEKINKQNEIGIRKCSCAANKLYRVSHKTDLNGSYLRETILFRMANADTDFYLVEDIKKLLNRYFDMHPTKLKCTEIKRKEYITNYLR